jgi:hypothetical protein
MSGVAELFGVGRDLVVVHGEAGVEDDVVEAVEGGSAEAVDLALGGQRGGGGEGGDAEDEVVDRVDVLFQRQLVAGAVPDFVGEVEVGAAGDLVGEHLAAAHPELGEGTVLEAAVEDLVGLFLDRVAVLVEEGEILHQGGGIREVGQDANAAAFGRQEHGAEQADEVEGRELAFFRVEQDVLGEVGREAGGWHGEKN